MEKRWGDPSENNKKHIIAASSVKVNGTEPVASASASFSSVLLPRSTIDAAVSVAEVDNPLRSHEESMQTRSEIFSDPA